MNFLQSVHVLPLLAPADGGSASTASGYLDISNAAGEIELEVAFGALTTTDTTSGGPTVTIEASTATTTTSAVALAFRYRMSAAVGTDSMGALTEVGSTGVGVYPSTDYANCTLLCYVDPAVVAEQGANYKYIHVDLAANALTAYLRYVTARFVHRFGEAAISST